MYVSIICDLKNYSMSYEMKKCKVKKLKVGTITILIVVTILYTDCNIIY